VMVRLAMALWLTRVSSGWGFGELKANSMPG
jgi:hypothetical protein